MEDQTDDTIVIHYPWIWNLTVWLVVGFFIARLTYRTYQNAIATSLVFLLILIWSSAEKRRKLEISSQGIAYWRQFGRPRRVKFADLSSVQK